MKMIRYLSKIFFLFCCMIVAFSGLAQLPQCSDSDQILYLDDKLNNRVIFNYDVSKPTSATNPIPNTISITVPIRGGGLAVSPDINTGASTLTFYTTGRNSNWDRTYYYYDDNSKTWVNTGHKASTGNLGAGGGYIYGVVAETGDVFKYDGKGDDVFVVRTESGILYDIIADNEGSFYVLSIRKKWMRKYSPSGVLLQEWKLSGISDIYGDGGFAVIDNAVYFDAWTGGSFRSFFLYKGVVCGDTIHFNAVDSTYSPKIADMANCPAPLYSNIKDTICYLNETSLNIKSSGNGPYTYTILDGSAQVSGSGPEFTVYPNSNLVTILLHATNHCNGLLTDTFTFIRYPSLDAGSDVIIYGCGQFIDTLYASLTDTIAGFNYMLEWSPADFITSGKETLHPVIQPTTNTTFTLKLSVSQCGAIRDTVMVILEDMTVDAVFAFDQKFGCVSDTVMFNNMSINNTHNFWQFGDDNTDTIRNPIHIYQKRGGYNVMLLTWNDWCSDSITRIVDTKHPLNASFIIEEDTVCQGSLVSFNNTSVSTFLPVAYYWDFGDGNSDNNIHTKHAYMYPGKYKTQLIIIDGLLCSDTFSSTVVVDSVPYISLRGEPREICVGQLITFESNYTAWGNTGISWNFGDVDFIRDISKDGHDYVSHAYDKAGIYPIVFSTSYRACEDTFATDTVYVIALPLVDLGPASILCLNSSPIVLMNYSDNKPEYHYLWNTGDTTQSIKVMHPGSYSLTVRDGTLGCSTTESVEITKDCYTDIPNAFTPNCDGENDYFFPRSLLLKSVTAFTMQIFNRWGQLIFETNNISGKGWDGRFNGREQPAGVYLYRIDVVTDGKAEHYQGNVTLLR